MKSSKIRWVVYDGPVLETVVAEFNTKRELLAYGEANKVNADCVGVFNREYPHGYVFLGWDEIEAF